MEVDIVDLLERLAVYNAFVQSLPKPVESDGRIYVWFYRLAHGAAFNFNLLTKRYEEVVGRAGGRFRASASTSGEGADTANQKVVKRDESHPTLPTGYNS